MTAKELFNMAPLGAFVNFSDGTPRPPERFKNKLAVWKEKNDWGYFVSPHPDNPSKNDASPTFTLRQDHGHMVCNKIIGIDSPLVYEAKAPAPGTILSYIVHDGLIQIKHVWPTLDDAKIWAGTRYKFAECGYKFYIIEDDGKRADYMPPDV